jgi:CelD/BcsL family acetyltransferase involved in cellulose biosynthesis
MLDIDVIRTEVEFAGLASEWDALVDAMPRPSPFLRHAWIAAWLRHYGAGREIFILLARRDGRLVAGLPLATTRRGWLRRLEFVGGAQSALADLLLVDDEDAAGRALVERAVRLPHDVADLYGLPGESRLRGLAGGLQLVERDEAPVLDLSAPWDAVYAAKLPSRARREHRRRRRGLEALGSLDVAVARDSDGLPAALEEAFRLHAMRRSGLPDESDFTTPRGMAFHRDLIVGLAAADVARIVLMRLSGQAIAFYYYFAHAGRMYAHCLGYDPAFARFSPGLLTTLDAIGFAAAEGLTRVEFLGGAEPYKLELADRFEPLYQAVGWPATWRGTVAAAGTTRAVAARRRLKGIPAVHETYVKRLAPARRVLRRLRG